MSAAHKPSLKAALRASLAAEDRKAADAAETAKDREWQEAERRVAEPSPLSFYVRLLTDEFEPKLRKGGVVIIDPTRPLTEGCFAYGDLAGGPILFCYQPKRHDGDGRFCKSGAANEEIGSAGGLRFLRSDIASGGLLKIKGVVTGWIENLNDDREAE